MRIGYFIPEFPGLTHIIFWREILRLRELGDDVRLVATRAPKYRSPHSFADAPCHYLWPLSSDAVAGFPGPVVLARQLRFIASLPEGGARERARVAALLPSSWMLARWLRRERIEHLHTQSFASSAYVAALAHIETGTPYSVTLHGGIDNYGLNHGPKLAGAAFACGVNGATRADIEGVAPGKVLAEDVPVGVDLAAFDYRERAPSETLRLISVNRLVPGKGVGLTLDALASLRDRVRFTYTIVGSGPAEGEFRAQAARLGLDDVVHFVGPASQAAVVDYLHASDVALLASFGTFETTAAAIREAMATGMPVIMTRVGEAERMIEPEQTGLIVTPGDTAAMAEAIAWFATHRDRIPEMGRAAHEKARAEFADTIGARRLHDAIQEHAAHFALA